VKAHGVVVAIPQEQSWAPTLVDRLCGERGNCPALPSSRAAGTGTGRCVVRCGAGQGGGPVVVAGVTPRHGGWESQPQGEGGQQVSSVGRGRPGDRR